MKISQHIYIQIILQYLLPKNYWLMQYTVQCIMYIHRTAGFTNLWPAGQIWPFSTKLWPFLNSEEQKEKIRSQKNLEEMAKKYELMALNKKGL